METVEEKHCRLEKARSNLMTPLTSKAETSEVENYGSTRPKTPSRAKTTAYAPNILPQEAVAQSLKSHSTLRQEQPLQCYAALLRDEVFNIIPGTSKCIEWHLETQSLGLDQCHQHLIWSLNLYPSTCLGFLTLKHQLRLQAVKWKGCQTWAPDLTWLHILKQWEDPNRTLLLQYTACS